MKSHDPAESPTLPEQHFLYCIKVVYTFLLAGVLLNKVSVFRELLEENVYHLSDCQHMSDLIPFILQQEKEWIKKKSVVKQSLHVKLLILCLLSMPFKHNKLWV